MTGRKKFALKPRPSLRDLAKQIGVSHTTVNLALQNNPKISESLRQKIRSLAAREGYFPNDLAWGLRSGRTGLVGIVLPNLTSFAPLADAACRFFWDSGYYPIILCHDGNAAVETEMLHGLARRRAEGIVLFPSPEEQEKGAATRDLYHHMPLVAVGATVRPTGLPLVTADEAQTIRMALQQLGRHRQIVRVGPARGARATGFSRLVREAGLKGKTVAFEPGTPAETLFAALDKETRTATAVLCDGDEATRAVEAWSKARGRQVPQELSVVAVSESGAPLPFTTVEPQADKLGLAAAETLVKRLANKAVPEETVIKPRLVKRDSVAKPPTRRR